MSNNTNDNNKINVAVLTTSGRWPKTGFESVPTHQKVKITLEEAARALRITSTDGWLARVAGRLLSPDGSWLANEITGEVTVDFGPRHGGGGGA